LARPITTSLRALNLSPGPVDQQTDQHFWEGAMLQSLMLVVVLAVSVGAVIGHVALLQAIMTRKDAR
jgi:hypothetical protein